MKTFIGIDPGSRCTGFGVIQSSGSRHRYLTSGNIRTSGEDMSQRCYQIYAGLSEIIQTYQPTHAAIELVFMSKNPNSAIKLGQARGAALVALAQYGLEVAEYSPRLIKQSVVGYGAADKSQVQHMIKRLLNLSDLPQVDAADALAVALCHCHARDVRELVAGGL